MSAPENLQDDEEATELSILVQGDDRDTSEVKLRVRGLRKESDAGTTILSGVDVDIPAGKIVGIVGPSGSGKSTFLRALNRLWEPPPGTVYLDGRDVCDLDVVNLRRRVGMLFQLPALFQGSVAENVRYGPKLKGKRLSDDEVHKLLSIADLDSSFYYKNDNELSVGQAQRVALARSLANEPEVPTLLNLFMNNNSVVGVVVKVCVVLMGVNGKVLLLDEPTSALDPISTQNIEDALLKLKKKGMTIVIVSHSIKQVQRVADLVYLFDNGTVVEVLEADKLHQAKHPIALRFLQIAG